jgi:tRNA A-37 threonylcarbamoyl transferase component Bud32
MMAHECPQDPVLPGLSEALDARIMRSVFAQELLASGDRVEACEVERVKYRPRRNCSVSYRLHIRRLADGSEYDQRVSARLCPHDEALHRLERAMAQAQQPSTAGPALRLLPARNLLTWWWPNDSKLVAPLALSDPLRVATRIVPPLVSALVGPELAGRTRCVQHGLDVVQYVPESRLTVRLRLQLDVAGRGIEEHVVFGKASREPSAAQSHHTLCQVHASASAQSGRIRVPRPLLLQSDHSLFWQQGLPGQALLDVPPAQAQAVMPALGAQLAALHGMPIQLLRTTDVPRHWAQLRDVVEVMAWSFPRLHATTVASARYLAEGWAQRYGIPVCPLHGDLHPRNVLVDGAQLALIDLDGMRMGPAEQELGAWIADAIYRSVLAGQDPFMQAPAWRLLLQAYGEASGQTVDLDTVAWATGWALLVQRAWRCVVNLKPGRYAIVPQLLGLVAAFSRPRAAELL